MESKRKILIMGYVWPEPRSSAAGLRDVQLVELFIRQGWTVHFSSGSRESQHSEALRAKGAHPRVLPANDSGFDGYIAELKPDWVIFDRFVTEEQFGWRVKEHSPNSIRIIDTQDLHFLRRARESALKEGIPSAKIKEAQIDFSSESTLRELASIYRSDRTWVLSDFELALLQDRFGIPAELLGLSRFHYPRPAPSSRSLSERKDFVFLGNFRHPPNADAVRWLNSMLWPRIRAALPETELHIYGAYPPKEMMALDCPEQGFRVKGPIEDHLGILSRYRLSLAPLRFGAGIKGKITDSWYSGTPVIATEIASEGMHEGLPWGGSVASDAEEFVTLATRFYQEPDLWSQGQSRGYRILEELYGSERTGPQLIESMEKLRAEVPQARSRNWVSQILWHQSLRSTEYFSRWIELKNPPNPSHSL